MSVNPLFLANNYIRRSIDEGISLSPMKLQKMLYYTYRDYLQQTDEPLFAERFSTWKYGPVLENVYHEFKHYGSSSINKLDAIWNDEKGEREAYCINEDSNLCLKNIINTVWNKYKYRTGIALSSMTHQPDGAWYTAFQDDQPYLLDDDIKKDTTGE